MQLQILNSERKQPEESSKNNDTVTIPKKKRTTKSKEIVDPDTIIATVLAGTVSLLHGIIIIINYLSYFYYILSYFIIFYYIIKFHHIFIIFLSYFCHIFVIFYWIFIIFFHIHNLLSKLKGLVMVLENDRRFSGPVPDDLFCK